MDSKTTVGLQNIVDLKDESIAELNTLHAKAVAVIDNTQVVAAANNAKTEVQAHINTEYTSCGDKRTEVRNNMTAHILNTDEVYNMNISKEIVKLPDEKDAQEANIINKIKSTPVSKIARDATIVGDVDINNVGLKKYVSGYKFPYKPNLYLNGGLVDNIHGITPRGYDSIKFREDGVFDNADSILTGQIVEGEYIWLGRETENIAMLGQETYHRTKYSNKVYRYNGLDIDLYSPVDDGCNFGLSGVMVKANCKYALSASLKSDKAFTTVYVGYKGVGVYSVKDVIAGDISYILNTDDARSCNIHVYIQKLTTHKCEFRNYQVEESNIVTPWVSYGQSRKPTNIMYDNIQSSQNIIYMEIFGKPKIQEDQITLVEGKDYDILVKKEISNLFIENQNNILLVNRKTNKIYLNGEIVNADLYIIINQEMVMKIEYDNYFMERSIIDLYRNIKPIGYDTLVWDKEDGTYSNSEGSCGGQVVANEGLWLGIGTENLLTFRNFETAAYKVFGDGFDNGPRFRMVNKTEHTLDDYIDLCATKRSVPINKTAYIQFKPFHWNINMDTIAVPGYGAALFGDNTSVLNRTYKIDRNNPQREWSYKLSPHHVERIHDASSPTNLKTYQANSEFGVVGQVEDVGMHTPFVNNIREHRQFRLDINTFKNYLNDSVIYIRFKGLPKFIYSFSTFRWHIFTSDASDDAGNKHGIVIANSTIPTEFIDGWNTVLIINSKIFINGNLANCSVYRWSDSNNVIDYMTFNGYYSKHSHLPYGVNNIFKSIKVFDKSKNPELWTDEFCKKLTR